MKDYSNLPTNEFYGLCEVLGDLYSHIDPSNVMVVGAAARDLIHRGFGFNFKLRSTTDIDVAVVLAEKHAYEQLTHQYARTGNSGIRFVVATHDVDIVPFGDIEDPQGSSYPSSSNHRIDVFGFGAVHAATNEYILPGGIRAKVPSPAGYCATKIKAWVDRSPNGEHKDASDMSYICYWFQRSEDIFELLYDEHIDLVIDAGLNTDIAAMHLLGSQVSDILGPELSLELARLWDAPSRERMALAERRDTTLGNDANVTYEHRVKNYAAIHSRLLLKTTA